MIACMPIPDWYSMQAVLGEDAPSEPGAVYSWAAHRVGFYVEALGRHLARIEEGGALASVLEHAMYCGMSLARVGLDFRMLLTPVFEACLLSMFARAAQVLPQPLPLLLPGSCSCRIHC